jgi:hypothetical protein
VDVVARIVRDAGVPDLLEILGERLAPTDLQSLLLEVARRRAARVSTADLLSAYERDRFTRPAVVDAAAVATFEQLAWSLLPDGYEAVELSPVCPLGANSAVATVDQNWVVTTMRGSEVVADSTNVLALECALRRRTLRRDPDRRSEPVYLAASHRLLRAQRFSGPGMWAHFRVLGLVAGGRDRGSFAFEAEALVQQIGYLIEVVGQGRPDWRLDVAVTDLASRTPWLQSDLLEPLAARWPDVTFRMDPERTSGRGYYVDACYKLFAFDSAGQRIELADGGCTTWTRRLISDAKERLVISGLGVDRILWSAA